MKTKTPIIVLSSPVLGTILITFGIFAVSKKQLLGSFPPATIEPTAIVADPPAPDPVMLLSNTDTSLHGSSQTSNEKPPAAYHEFVMFGNDTIYLSHYTMFHAIHSYQIIFAASFKKDKVDVVKAFLDDRREHPDRSYTVSPSKKGSPLSRRRDDWILPDYMHDGMEFNADIHWGEEPEEFLFRDVTVHIDRIILDKKFEEADQHDARLNYLLFGTKGDRYLAHLIGSFPDFDDILSIDIENDQFPSNPGLKFTLDKENESSDRLQGEGKEFKGILQPVSDLKKVEEDSVINDQKIKLKSEIYFEDIEEQG